MRDNKQNFHFKKNVIMQSENRILGNQLVAMSMADLDALVEKMASNMIAMRVEDKSTHESDVCPVVHDDERFITREEAAHILHVNFTTLWRWDKQGHLHSRKIGGRRMMYKYSDVLALLNGEINKSKDE